MKNTRTFDVVLINPSDPPATYPPLGLCYLAAMLEAAGISVLIIDRPSQELDDRQVIAKLVELKPKIVGITVMTTLLRSTYNIIKGCRALDLDITYLVGGPYINIEPEIIGEMDADYAIIGDAELSIVSFCRSILEGKQPDSKLEGLVYKKPNGTIVKNEPALFPSLETMPLPAYHLLDLDKYLSSNFNLRTISMITARGGCPYTCNFCGNLMKERYRFLNPEYVCDQIESVISRFNTEYVEFVDETFTLNKHKATELCNMIIGRGISIKWACLTRVDKLDENLIILMRKAGCVLIRFGVESGNERVRYISDKRITNQRYLDIIKMCKKHGIKVLCFYIFGHPTETITEMKETISFSLKLPSDTVAYSKMEPIPNSKLFDQALAEKKITKDVWTNYMLGKISPPIYYPDTIVPADMERIYKTAYFRYYTSYRALSNFAPMMVSPTFWKKAYKFLRIISSGEGNLP